MEELFEAGHFRDELVAVMMGCLADIHVLGDHGVPRVAYESELVKAFENGGRKTTLDSGGSDVNGKLDGAVEVAVSVDRAEPGETASPEGGLGWGTERGQGVQYAATGRLGDMDEEE